MSNHTQTDQIGQHECEIQRRMPGHAAAEDVFVRIHSRGDTYLEMSEVAELYNAMRDFETRTR